MNQLIVKPATRALSGRVAVPGDKSVSHRSLLFGAMASGSVEVKGLGTGEDNLRTRRIVTALGARVEDKSPTHVIVHGVGMHGFKAAGVPLDCGNSGTSIRLLCGMLAGQPFASTLIGDHSLSGRPMKRVVEPLSQMGANITGQSGAKAGDLYPPLTVQGGRLHGIEYTSKVASAQVKSAILIAGLYAEGTTEVLEPGPSRDHTERMLSYLGAPIQWADLRARLVTDDWDRVLEARPIFVPGDPSSAAFLIAAGLVCGAESLVVENVCTNETRTGFLEILAAMGARIERLDTNDAGVEPIANLQVTGGRGGLKGQVVGGEVIVRAIDELPVLAVLAATGSGVTEFKDAEELRVKESDRVKTTCEMLRAFGVDVEERPDGMKIQGLAGKPFRAAKIHAHADHRIAMSAAIAGLNSDGETVIDDAANVMTSFPTFVSVMNTLGADVTAR